jgi:hypothetical protein
MLSEVGAPKEFLIAAITQPCGMSTNPLLEENPLKLWLRVIILNAWWNGFLPEKSRRSWQWQ